MELYEVVKGSASKTVHMEMRQGREYRRTQEV